MTKRPVYQELATRSLAMDNCLESGNLEWYDKHEEVIDYIVRNYLPYGSGIDSTYKVQIYTDGPGRIVLHNSFHLMDENGMYDGWLDFSVTVTTSLVFGIVVNVRGQFSQRNGKHADLKDYLMDIFEEALSKEIDIQEVAAQAGAEGMF